MNRKNWLSALLDYMGGRVDERVAVKPHLKDKVKNSTTR
jgi:hypothetical protein